MAHAFGGLELPAPAPANSQEAVTDPGLTLLADYLKTTLLHYLDTAWSAVAPSEPLIRHARWYDPTQYGLRDQDLPALYLWREQEFPVETTQEPAALIDGLLKSTTDINLMWVFPPQSQDQAALRQPIFNGIAKALRRVVAKAQDPSWVNAADTDPGKATFGSDLLTLAGFDRLTIKRPDGIKRGALVPEMPGGAPLSYPAIAAVLAVDEVSSEDPDLRIGEPLRTVSTDINLEAEIGEDPIEPLVDTEVELFQVNSITASGTTISVTLSKNFSEADLPNIGAWQLSGTAAAVIAYGVHAQPVLKLTTGLPIEAEELGTAKLRLVLWGQPIVAADGLGTITEIEPTTIQAP